MKVKGLEGISTGIGEKVKEEKEPKVIENFESLHGYAALNEGLEENECLDPLYNVECENTINMGKGIQITSNDEVSLKINAMIEKNEGVWECKVCGKTSPRNSSIRSHAERHIEGMCYPCSICSKTFPNRKCLSKHISNNHSELFSCDDCGKTGMNRLAYRDHKRRQHKPLPVNQN